MENSGTCECALANSNVYEKIHRSRHTNNRDGSRDHVGTGRSMISILWSTTDRENNDVHECVLASSNSSKTRRHSRRKNNPGERHARVDRELRENEILARIDHMWTQAKMEDGHHFRVANMLPQFGNTCHKSRSLPSSQSGGYHLKNL